MAACAKLDPPINSQNCNRLDLALYLNKYGKNINFTIRPGKLVLHQRPVPLRPVVSTVIIAFQAMTFNAYICLVYTALPVMNNK